LSLKSSPSSRPILFGTSKTLVSSPLSGSSYIKDSPKVLEENDEDSDSTYESPTIKRQKRTAGSSYTISPLAPSSPTSSAIVSKDQELIEEVDLQDNTKAGSKRVSRFSRKSKPSKKMVENALID
jgi:hypothetical protein